jgi:hypothetical protein
VGPSAERVQGTSEGGGSTEGISQAGEIAEGKTGKSKGPVNLSSPENVPPFYSKAARVAFEKLEKRERG